jgi:hypothetical protein
VYTREWCGAPSIYLSDIDIDLDLCPYIYIYHPREWTDAPPTFLLVSTKVEPTRSLEVLVALCEGAL